MDRDLLTLCPTHGPKDGAYCNECGTRVVQEKITKDTPGTWRVTTEGDCEGRTTKDLGTWFGTVASVAKRLADHVGYSLKFEPVAGSGRSAEHGKVYVSVCGKSLAVEW